jgi:hypothetical protein
MSQLADIKVPDVVGSDSATVTEVIVHRGEWVESNKVVVRLTAGVRRIDVTPPGTGVITKVLVKKGDSVSRGAVLVQLKIVTEPRPSFGAAWNTFSRVSVSVPEVGRIIGGKVNYNINEIPAGHEGRWTNACAIRMSYVLNKTGFPVRRGNYLTSSGADGMWYIPRVNDIMTHLRNVFGAPDIVAGHTGQSPAPDDFKGMKGILVVTGDGWGDADGHATLWNGSMCSDSCHLAGDPSNGTFIPHKAELWILP